MKLLMCLTKHLIDKVNKQPPSVAHPNYTYLAIPPCPMPGECYTLNDTYKWY